MEEIKVPKTMQDLLSLFVNYVENQRRRPMTIIELQNYEKKLNELSNGDFEKARDIVNYSMDRKIINFREPSKNYMQTKKQMVMNNRNIPDDDLEALLVSKSQSQISKAVEQIRSEIFGDEFNKLSLEQRQEKRRMWRRKWQMSEV